MWKNLLTANVPLGNWFGVPVYLHISFVFVWLLLALTNPQFAIVWTALFCIVLAHEFGHIFMGRHFGCEVKDVVLYPIGGAAKMAIPQRPVEELLVALAGPAVNLAMVPPLALVWDWHVVLSQIALCNIMIMVFNLIPAFPMDGGRVFRSLLALATGNWLRSTIIAVRTGQVITVLFMGLGLWTFNLALCIVGLFVFIAAENELEMARQKVARQILSDTADALLVHPDVQQSAELLNDIQRQLASFDQRHNQ